MKVVVGEKGSGCSVCMVVTKASFWGDKRLKIFRNLCSWARKLLTASASSSLLSFLEMRKARLRNTWRWLGVTLTSRSPRVDSPLPPPTDRDFACEIKKRIHRFNIWVVQKPRHSLLGHFQWNNQAYYVW